MGTVHYVIDTFYYIVKLNLVIDTNLINNTYIENWHKLNMQLTKRVKYFPIGTILNGLNVNYIITFLKKSKYPTSCRTMISLFLIITSYDE